MDNFFSDIITILKTSGLKLLAGLLVLVLGLWAVRFVTRWARRRIEASQKLKIEPTASKFISNIIRIILYTIVMLTAANIMGIPMTSVVAVVASAGVAVSLAMQGALSNLVGGVMLVILKPIAVREYVKIGDLEGTVQAIGAIYTELTTFDGKRVVLPNSTLTNTPITNFTRVGRRRVDLTFSVAYGSDMDRVMGLLRDLTARTPDILPDPAPVIHLNACADSSLDFVVRVWTDTPHYWDAYYALMENGKRALDENGIEIPFPQMDVHVKN